MLKHEIINFTGGNIKNKFSNWEKLTNDKLYGQVYDFPGHDSLQFLRINQAPLTFKYDDLVMSSGSKFGVMLFNIIRQWQFKT